MIKIDIDHIVKEIYSKTEQEEMKRSFLMFASRWSVDEFWKKATKWESGEKIENRGKYKKYDSTSQKMLLRKKTFFERLYTIWMKHCCYCWKVPIIHYEKGVVIKTWAHQLKKLYDIEHFLPRSKYPDLSINLYNWLPVCISCNQRLKSDSDPLDIVRTWWKIFHPYFWWLHQCKSWYIHAKNTDFDSNFNFVGNADLHSLHSEHSKFFKLPQIYLNSQDTFNTFKFIQDKRNKMKAEKNHYAKNSWKDTVEMKNYFFKNYYPEAEKDILKYANGKLKKDLIQNLYLDTK